MLHKETAIIPNWTSPGRVPSGSARLLLLEEDDYAVNNSKGTASPYSLKHWIAIGPTVVVCLLSRLERPTNAGMHVKRKLICHLTVRRLRAMGLCVMTSDSRSFGPSHGRQCISQ